MTLSGISTQGHKEKKDWVVSYKIKYSITGVSYHGYHELGKKKVFFFFLGKQNSNYICLYKDFKFVHSIIFRYFRH